MIFEELEEFKKDLKTLLKKYRSLNEDLEVVKKILSVSIERQGSKVRFEIDICIL